MTMSKHILMAAMAVLVLVACNKEPETNDDGQKNSGLTGDAPQIAVSPSQWNFPAAGELSASFDVTCSSDEWATASSASWLNIESSSTGLTLTASENAENEARSTEVTLTVTDENGSSSATISVSQDGRAYISLSEDSVTIDAAGGTASITAQSNFKLGYTFTGGWLSLSIDGETLSVTAAQNDSDSDRSCVITLSAGDGLENNAEASLTVLQAGGEPDEPDNPDEPEEPDNPDEPDDSDSLVLEYTLSSATSVTLPISGTVSCTVDWGDGSTETVSSAFPTHSYTASGTYDVKVSGTVTALSCEQFGSDQWPLLTAVVSWGDTGLTAMDHAFSYCSGLKSIPATTGDALAGVNTFTYAFYGCTSLASIPSDLFTDGTALTSMEYVFYKCSSLTSIPSGLFDNCTNVNSFRCSFGSCSSLLSIPAKLFDNCSAVTTFQNAFAECSSLTTMPDNLFSSCTAVTNFEYVFDNCTSLTDIGSGIFDGCVAATDFQRTFEGCTSITTIPDGLFDSCAEVTWFFGTFSGCSSLTSIPASLFDNNRNVSQFNYCFSNCTRLTGESPYTLIDGEKVHLYERSDHPSDFTYTNPTSSFCFSNCENLTDWDDIPTKWKGV
ncbi:MAG: leucine-rich repeat protein [Bacteroidales bacterium]|nr:leucine-rich repeat protein [Bacteroidales bacterium]